MMEEIVKELKKVVPFKESTFEGDIVLIAMADPASVVYALVTEIDRDETKRDEWWHVTMHILSVPPQKVTWILRESQFTGKEIFTMGNEGRFVKAIDFKGPGADKKVRKENPKKKNSPRKTSLHLVK